jgi:mannitol-1-phosphate/altronate dehydrogenase
MVVAGYLRYLQGEGEKGEALPLIDPLAEPLRALARSNRDNPRAVLEGAPEVFGTELPRADAFVAQLTAMLRDLNTDGVKATLRRHFAS